MAAKHNEDSDKEGSQHILWKASCSIKALSTILAAVNADEIELTDEDLYGLSQILQFIAGDIDRVRDSDENAEI